MSRVRPSARGGAAQRGSRRITLSLVALLAGAGAWPSASAAQGSGPEESSDPDPRLSVTAYGGLSMREGFDGFRFARDVLTYGARLAWLRPHGVQPWVEGAGFHRPDLVCLPGVQCAEEGWLGRVGVAVPLQGDDSSPLRGAILAGVGGAVAEEVSVAYVFGVGVYWAALGRVLPAAELRWETVAEVNVAMLALGIRVDF